MVEAARAARQLTTLSVASALVGLVGLVAAGLALNAGYFEYPLDDVYIHLAMADGIARGEYGINPGEYASAASSVLYPLLLAPFHAAPWIRFVPFGLNLAALVLCATLWGGVLATSALSKRTTIALALGGPIALNMTGLAFLGMEHALHLAAVLAVLLGLWRFLSTATIPVALIAAIILCPLLRFEGLGLSLLAVLTIAARGRIIAAALLSVGVLAPIAVFVLFLNAHGIGPLPNSVMAKSTFTATQGLGPLVGLLINLVQNLRYPAGWLLVALILTLTFQLARTRKHDRNAAALVFVALAVVTAQLFLGQIVSIHRYEIYALVFAVGALILTYNPRGTARVVDVAIGSLLALAILAIYPVDVAYKGPRSARAIHAQQGQMMRLAQDLIDAPVAVNDIGLLAWRSRHPVLDLAGLASRQSMRLRVQPDADPRWAVEMAAKAGVKAVMIYDTWFARLDLTDWTKVGTIEVDRTGTWLGHGTVSVYATSPAEAPKLRAQLDALAHDAPPATTITVLP